MVVKRKEILLFSLTLGLFIVHSIITILTFSRTGGNLIDVYFFADLIHIFIFGWLILPLSLFFYVMGGLRYVVTGGQPELTPFDFNPPLTIFWVFALILVWKYTEGLTLWKRITCSYFLPLLIGIISHNILTSLGILVFPS